MAAALLESVTGLFTKDVVRAASATLDESDEATRLAVRGAIPLLVLGLARFGRINGHDHVATLVRDHGVDAPSLASVEVLLGGGAASDRLRDTGNEILGRVFQGTGNVKTLAGAVAAHSGIGSKSARSLMAMSMAVVLGALRKDGADGAAIAKLLAGSENAARDALPQSIAGAFAGMFREAVVRQPPEWVALLRSWGLPAIATILGSVAFVLFLKWWLDREPPPSPPPPPVTTSSTTSPSTTLPTVRPNGVAWRVAQFLADLSMGPPPRTFVFDHLNFESGSTRLTPESFRTISDLVTVLQNFPTAEVRLEGHTDDVGDRVANTQLSLARAEVVHAALVAGGVASQRITMAGYGSDRPVVSNQTPEGRGQNRRIELVVLRR